MKKAAVMEFHTWLKEQMDRRPDLTQFKLAEMLGVKPASVSHWVTGRSRPRPEHVAALSEIFKVERATLYQLLNIETGDAYDFKVIGPLVEEIDRTLLAIEDPRVRAMAEERLKSDIRSLRDTIEHLSEIISSAD